MHPRSLKPLTAVDLPTPHNADIAHAADTQEGVDCLPVRDTAPVFFPGHPTHADRAR